MCINHTSQFHEENKKPTSFAVPDVHCPLKVEVILSCLLSRSRVTCRWTNIDPEGVVNKFYTLCIKYRYEGQNEVHAIFWQPKRSVAGRTESTPLGDEKLVKIDRHTLSECIQVQS